MSLLMDKYARAVLEWASPHGTYPYAASAGLFYLQLNKKNRRKEAMRYVKYEDLESAGVLSVNEAAHVLRIGRTRLYDLIKLGQIKTLKFLRPIRISARWLKLYIDDQLPADDGSAPYQDAQSSSFRA